MKQKEEVGSYRDSNAGPLANMLLNPGCCPKRESYH